MHHVPSSSLLPDFSFLGTLDWTVENSFMQDKSLDILYGELDDSTDDKDDVWVTLQKEGMIDILEHLIFPFSDFEDFGLTNDNLMKFKATCEKDSEVTHFEALFLLFHRV